MANIPGSKGRHKRHAQYPLEQDGQATLPQRFVASSSPAPTQLQLRPQWASNISFGGTSPSRRAAGSPPAASSPSDTASSRAQSKTARSKDRALGLLYLASSLVASLSSIQQVSARSHSLRRHSATGVEEARFAAGIAHERDEQQSRQLEQREVVDVAKVIFMSNDSAIADLEDGQNSSSSSLLNGRWGHSSTYLKNEQTVIFVGGQIAIGTSLSLTSDVFALNVSSLVTNSTSGPLSPWEQLSSDGLAPHAFAGQALTHDSTGADQIWLLGGYTDDCSAPAAWTWTAGEDLNSSWSAVEPTVGGLTRKARSPTIGVPSNTGLAPGRNATGAAVMMLGGLDVSKECSSLAKRSEKSINSSVIHHGAVVWQLGHKGGVAAREMAVNDADGSFSLVDYSTVTVPAKDLGESTIFFGGITNNDTFADWNQLWSFNPWTSSWKKFITTGDVPSGRRGHTSTLLSGNRVVVIGGLVEKGTLSDDVYILNLNETPATWSKPTYAKDSTISAPARAYQSALLIDEVLVVAFGAKYNLTASSGESTVGRREAENTLEDSSSLFYLDTSVNDAWRWSDSIEGVLEGRGVVQAVATTTSSSSTMTTSSSRTSYSTSTHTASSASATNNSSAKTITGDGADSTSFSAAPAQSTSADVGAGSSSSLTAYSSTSTRAQSTGEASRKSSAPATATSGNSDGNHTLSTAGKAGAVVGSLLGVAAFAVVLGGLYAYKKRSDSYKEWEGTERDMERRGGPRDNRGNAVVAPPVSMLWFHDLKRGKNGSGNNDGSLTQSSRGQPRRSDFRVRGGIMSDPYPYAVNSAVAFPDGTVYSSASYDEYLNFNPQRPPTSPFTQDEISTQMMTLNRNQSSESLASSIGGASHCSYPYLSAMHRPSLGGSQSSPNPSSATTTPALLAISPREAMTDQAIHFIASPVQTGIEDQSERFSVRDVLHGWDPEMLELKSATLPREKGADDSFDSIVIDAEDSEDGDESEEEECVAELSEQKMHIDLRHHQQQLHYVHAVPRTNGGRAYSLPHHADLAKTLSTSSAPTPPRAARVTSHRAKRSMLRVTNASQETDW